MGLSIPSSSGYSVDAGAGIKKRSEIYFAALLNIVYPQDQTASAFDLFRQLSRLISVAGKTTWLIWC